MASERAIAKREAIPDSEEVTEPAALRSVISDAQALKLELAREREEHRHAESLRSMELTASAEDQRRSLGVFGRMFGGSTTSPIAISFLVVVAGLVGVFYCLHAGAHSNTPEIWFHEAEWAGALSASALSFIFGRAGKR